MKPKMIKSLPLIKTLKVFAFLTVLIQLSGCSAILIPSKQTVTITTGNEESKVFLNSEQFGEGKSITGKVKKSGVQQVVIQTPGYKDNYYSLTPVKVVAARAPLVVLSFAFFIYPGMVDVMAKGGKFHAYMPTNHMPPTNKLVNRTPEEKYIQLDAIALKMDDKNKDVRDYYGLTYKKNTNLMAEIEKAEKAQELEDKKTEAKQAKSKKNKKVVKLNDEDNKISYDDTKFSDMITATLKKTGYIDTVNKVFSDNNNTLILEGVIKKASVFHINGSYGSFIKTKMNINWYIKNSFGEKVDSINLWGYSGDFRYSSGDYYYPANQAESDMTGKVFADAVQDSYFNLLKNGTFVKHLKADTNFSITDPILSLKTPSKTVQDISEASSATVTIKRKSGGHGSGFAITEDGYILTNYHVISGKDVSKTEEISVILSDGEEVPVTVARYNKMRDIALLKVDRTFEKAFALNETKSYKKLMEVYTVGTPKSMELGQTVSIGLLSNERKANNNNLLQISISVNPGNSGGPLFEKTGSLHGIVTSKLVGYATEGVGFAIPSYMVPSYLNLAIQ